MPRALANLVQRAFGAGELAPGLYARADIALYQQAARTIRNFLIQRHGGVANRSGTRYVATVKSGTPSLLKFIEGASTAYLLEVGSGYLRFYKNGARVNVSAPAAWSNVTNYAIGDLVSFGGVNYWSRTVNINKQPDINPSDWYALTGTILEVPTPFTANLDLVRGAQDLSTLTLTHQDYAPQELKRLGSDTAWSIAAVTTAPGIAPPVGTSGAAGAAGALTVKYVITARKVEDYEESLQSAMVTIAASAEPTQAAPNVISWTNNGAVEYRVYKDPFGNGVFGYLGTSTGTPFNDAGFAPDFGLTPPLARTLFNAVNTYPHTAAYYQQRRVFANSHALVSTVWASRTGFVSNFSIRSPLQEDDAVTFAPKGPQVVGIQHLIGLERLVMLTDFGEWIVLGDEGTGLLTPYAIHPEQKGHSGSAARPIPIVIGSTVIYTQYLSRVVRDLRFNETYTGFETNDLTIFASHLFKHTVLRQDAQIIPWSIGWFVRDDGVLLGLTYIPELQQYGWHRHDTADGGDTYKDVAVLPEGDEHAVYVLVARAGLGTYVERFATRTQFDAGDVEDAYFVDGGITYSGGSTTAINGLAHLNGRVVYAWTKTAGGLLVQGPFTVSAGAITLTTAATKAHVGLRITAQLETLPLDVGGTALRLKRKKVQGLTAIVEASMPGWFAGPDVAHLVVVRREGWQSATALSDDRFEVNLTSSMTDEGRVLIQHVNPTPLTILGLVPQFQEGG